MRIPLQTSPAKISVPIITRHITHTMIKYHQNSLNAIFFINISLTNQSKDLKSA